VINFRTEVEAKVDYSHETIPFMIEADLMFAEAQDPQIKNPKNIPEYITDTKFKTMNFKSVSVRKFKINSMLKGISEHYPITFDSAHFAALSIVIHSAIMGK
jgi:hypothetical protein